MGQRSCFDEFKWWLPFIICSALSIALPIVFDQKWWMVVIIYASVCAFLIFINFVQGRLYNYGWFPVYVKSDRSFEGTDYWCIVTGANSGTGFETTKEMVRRGCNTIITCRSQSKIDTTIERIQRELQNESSRLTGSNIGKIEGVIMDLCSKKSIDAAVGTILGKNVDICILYNNAGAWLSNVHITEDGIEAQWQANYLSPFYFTKKLLPNIKACAKKLQYGRIINVASIGHQVASVDNFDAFISQENRGNLDYWLNKQTVAVYGDTKCAQILHAQKLQEILNDETDDDGKSVGSYLWVISLHPGFINSGFVNLSSRAWWLRPIYLVFYPFTLFSMISTKQGAQTSLHCALNDDDVKPGGYHAHCKPQPTKSQADPVINTKKDSLYQATDAIWNEAEA